MSSTTAFPSVFIFSEAPSFLLRRGSGLSFFTAPTSFVCYPRSSNSRILHIYASPLHPDVDISSFPPDPNSPPDNYGGLAVVQAPPTHKTKKKGFSSIFVGSIMGSSLATVIAIAYFLFYRKAHSHNRERIVAPIVNSTQQESLLVVKNLTIIEIEMRPEEICTRREYARWLVRTSSLIERNLRHRIVPSIALSGSETAAFDDFGADDPDFEFIQALAEAGIIPSKLSDRSTTSDGSKGVDFFPD